jgi:autotransporter adhesin
VLHRSPAGSERQIISMSTPFVIGAALTVGLSGLVSPVNSQEICSESTTGRLACGTGAAATGANSTAIGAGAQASADSSVAVGQGSQALEANTVSIGSAGAERRLVNVAVGRVTSTSTDAVTGSQLHTTNEAVVLNSVAIVANTAAIAINTTAITNNRDSINGIAAAFGGGAAVSGGVFSGPAYVIQGGPYTSVGGALTALDTQVTTNTTSISNIINGRTGLVQQAAPGASLSVGAATDGASVDFSGLDGARTLTGVAAGAISAVSSEAVTGSQLYGAAESIAVALDGGAFIDGNGRVTTPSYTIQGQSVAGVGSALTRLDGQVTANTVSITNLSNTVGVVSTSVINLTTDVTNLSGEVTTLKDGVNDGTIGIVQRNSATGGIGVASNFGGTVVNFAGTDGARVLSGVASGIAATDAVNVGQLNAAMAGIVVNVPIRGNNTSSLAAPVATGSDALSIGYGSIASGNDGLAVGTRSQATGQLATAVGSRARASGGASLALGAGSSATGLRSTTSGSESRATGIDSAAYGAGAQALSSGTTSIGAGAIASAEMATVIGSQATGAGSNASAIGASAVASGSNTTALGQGAQATADSSMAVGQGSKAEFANSSAIGTNAATTRANQVAVGTASSTYTLAGITSLQSQGAQRGPTRLVTTDAAGNLGVSDFDFSSIVALDGRVGDLEAGLNELSRFSFEARREARQGIAAAMAMTSAAMPSAPGRTSWTMNGATFQGEYAFGASVAHRLDIQLPVALTAGYAYGGNNSHGVRVGLSGEF